MLVSYKWLNEYFGGSLPKPAELADALTMNSFEIEGIEGEGDSAVIDVKVLPNRAHDCLSHRGVAREIGMVLGLRPSIPETAEPYGAGDSSIGLIVETDLSPRCMFQLIEGVKVGSSPKWLKDRLELLGQRSISNVVDITNYAMLETGQPMHAFDAGKLVKKDGRYSIGLKAVAEETSITTLGGKEYKLPAGTLVFTDENREGYNILDIAGTKGGVLAEVDEGTTSIALTAANFDQSYIRKFSRRIGIQTDATKRSENGIAPELAGLGLALTAKLVSDIAGDGAAKAELPAEYYPRRRRAYKVGVSTAEANRLLGTALEDSEVEAILARTGWEWKSVDPRKEVVARAKELVGKPYKLGASVSFDAPEIFDCSSLTAYLYADAGIALPRVSVDQFVFGAPVDMADAKEGDLIFFNTKLGHGKVWHETHEWLKGTKVEEGVSHVGIWLGANEMIDATIQRGSVVRETIEESGRTGDIVGLRRMPGADSKRYVVTVPAERLDLRRKEDLIEEIGRLHGFDKIPTVAPSPAAMKPAVNKGYFYAEKARRVLAGLGFSEVYTYAFVPEGEVEVANPLASDKGRLRPDLGTGVAKSLEFNMRYADLLGLDEIRIFEIGKAFAKDREYNALCIAADIAKAMKKKDEAAAAIVDSACAALSEALGVDVPASAGKVLELDLDALVAKLPDPVALEFPGELPAVRFKSISPYPFVLRDIAVWVPESTAAEAALDLIRANAGELMVTDRLFDTFTKDFEGEGKKTSYAFRLVFQSYERTLTDDEVNAVMEKVTAALDSEEGWKVR